MTSRPFSAAFLLCLAAAGCGEGGGKATPTPDEALFASGLAHYDAANALAAEARALLDAGARAVKEAGAVAEYGLAQLDFEALPVQYPASARLDNAAYLDGRCDYEVGSITGERSRFVAARTRLDAAVAAYPASKQRPSMLYFAARAVFQTAELDQFAAAPSSDAVAALYADARQRFVAAVAAAAALPGALYGDNAAYYQGRSDFELGLVWVSPLEAGAPAPAPGSAGWNAADAAFGLAETELAAVPTTSTYRDNARYYLGRTRYERPADVAATRIAYLQAAITAFTETLAVGPGAFSNGALYWRGRARYALAFRQGTGGVPQAAGLDAALADLKSVAGAGAAADPAASVYADNALSYEARCYVNLVPAVCQTARAGDAAPPSACAARAALAARYPASVWLASTDAYLAAAACTCP